MPPSIVDTLKKKVTSIFAPQKVSEPSTPHSNEHTRDHETVRSDSVEVVPPPSSRPNKRVRDGTEEQSGRNTKAAKLDSRTRSLTGDYSRPAPTDSTAITITNPRSEYDVKEDWNPGPQKPSMGAYKAHGLVKPKNTLHDVPHAARGHDVHKQSPQGNIYTGVHQNRQAGRTQLQLEGSTGSNARKAASRVTDGLDEDGRNVKKRRLDNGHHSELSSDPVDLTDGENDIITAKPVPRRPQMTTSTSQESLSAISNKSKKKSAYVDGDAFGTNSESRMTDGLVNGWPSKPKSWEKRSQDSHVQPSTSKANLPATRKPGSEGGLPPPGTVNSPFHIDDDDTPSQNGSHRTFSPNQGRKATGSQRPPINLTDGLDQAGRTHGPQRMPVVPQGSLEDYDQVGAVFERNKPKKSTLGQTARVGPTSIGKRSIQQTGPLEPRPSASKFMRGSPPGRGKLAQNFVRDDQDEVTEVVRPLMKPPQRTQKAINEAASADESQDELQGDRTVPSHGSRSVSPMKPPSSTKSSTKAISASSRRQEQHSAGLASTANSSRSGTQIVKLPVHAPEIEELDGERIAIRSIHCRGCVSQDKNLELVWDHDSQSYRVVATREKLRVPHTNTPVAIGKSEVRTVVGCRDFDGVQLKVSSGPVSNGSIIILFKTMQGRHDFLNRLSGTPSIKMELNKSLDYIEKLCKKQISETSLAFEKLKAPKTVQSADIALVEANQRRKAGLSSHEEDQDEIKYETESQQVPKRRQTAGSRMQRQARGDTMADALVAAGLQEPRSSRQSSNDERSRYFAEQEPRRTTRKTKPAKYKEETPPLPQKWTELNNPKPWKYSVVYPETGPRRITVDFQDLGRLDDGEFLNDNVISFQLRYIEENMDPKFRERVYFFSTFFYSALCSKGKKDFSYDAVKRWTKSVDLLDKDYIVVPINQDLHWFVAIICNLPSLERKLADSDDAEPAEDKLEEDEKIASSSAAVKGESEDHMNEQDQNIAASVHERVMEERSPSDKHSGVYTFDEDGKADNARPEGAEDNDLVSSARAKTAKGKKSKRKSHPIRKFSTTKPMFISLDSFGNTRTPELRKLKMYIAEEAKAKRNMAVDMEDLQGVTAKGIPQQPNFYDCGVFLLGYVMEFAKDPDAFVKKILERQMTEDDFENFNATNLRNEIRGNLLEMAQVQEEQHLKLKRERASARKAAQQPPHPPGPNSVSQSAQQLDSHAAATHAEIQTPSKPSRDPAPAETLAGTSQTMDFEHDELPVSPPKTRGPGAHASSTHPQPSSSAPTEVFANNAHEEMLDVEREAHNEHMPDHVNEVPSSSVSSNQQPPQEHFLEGMEDYANAGNGAPNGEVDTEMIEFSDDDDVDNGEGGRSKQTTSPDIEPNGPVIVELGDEQDNTLQSQERVEIPDSQEAVLSKGTHTKFED